MNPLPAFPLDRHMPRRALAFVVALAAGVSACGGSEGSAELSGGDSTMTLTSSASTSEAEGIAPSVPAETVPNASSAPHGGLGEVARSSCPPVQALLPEGHDQFTCTLLVASDDDVRLVMGAEGNEFQRYVHSGQCASPSSLIIPSLPIAAESLADAVLNQDGALSFRPSAGSTWDRCVVNVGPKFDGDLDRLRDIASAIAVEADVLANGGSSVASDDLPMPPAGLNWGQQDGSLYALIDKAAADDYCGSGAGGGWPPLVLTQAQSAAAGAEIVCSFEVGEWAVFVSIAGEGYLASALRLDDPRLQP